MSQVDSIASLLEAGDSPEQLVKTLVDAGWHPEVATRVVTRQQPCAPAAHVPGPDVDLLPSSLNLGDALVDVQFRMRCPEICLLANFLSTSECEQLIEEALPRLERSKVAGENGSQVASYGRTSEQAVLRPGCSPLADVVRARVARMARWPETCIEPAQVVRYRTGADFAPHNDYWCPVVHRDIVERSGQRLATVILYLNTPEVGGVTAFQDIELEVFARQGQALYFAYPYADLRSRSTHAGVPLGRGEKWIATFFLCERPVVGTP